MNKSIQNTIDFCRDNRVLKPHEVIRLGEDTLSSFPCDESEYITPKARIQFYMGQAYANIGKHPIAIEYFRNILSISESLDQDLVANANTGMANVLLLRGDYFSSITFLETALKIQKKAKNIRKISHLLHSLGICQHQLKNLKAAKSNFLTVIDVCEKQLEKSQLYNQTLTSLGIVCIDYQEFAEADVYINRALRNSEAANDLLGIANAKAELGRLYAHYKNTTEALRLCEEGEKEFLELGYEGYAAEVKLYKGQIFKDPSTSYYDLKRAQVECNEALKIARKGRDLALQIKIHKALSEAYELEADIENELHHFKLFHKLDQTLQQLTTKRRIEHLQILLEVDHERKKNAFQKVKNSELEVANTHLNKLVKERRELMSLAAHDLKNPISSIISIVDFLKDHPCYCDYSDIPAFIELLEQSSKSTMSIISNILEDNRLEEGQCELLIEPTNLNNLCREVLQLHCHRALKKGIQLKYKDSSKTIIVPLDAFSLRQSIDNLISNAIKFSSEGNHVTVELKEGKDVEIRIIDDGPGITPEDQNKLFCRFAKLSNKPTANESSSGLGLSIVKKLVEMNKGKIICVSNPGEGSTFIIRLSKPSTEKPQDTSHLTLSDSTVAE